MRPALLCLALFAALTSRRADDAEDARALFDKAVSALNARQYKGAAELLEKALRLQPDNDTLLANLGYAEAALGRTRGALEHSEKAIARNDTVAWYHVNAAIYAQRLGEHDKARKHARRALTFRAPDLSAEHARAVKEIVESYRPRTYTVRWKLDPRKGWGQKGRGKGPFYVPLPSTGLPYQSATYTVRGARSYEEVTRDGERLLRFEADGPVELTGTVTVRFHDYRPRVKEWPWRCPDEVRAYLGRGPRVDPGNKKVQQLAAKLKGDTPAATVQNILAWFKENLTYKNVPFERAEQLIERGHGECGAYSALFVALCRASGIPAREVWGPVKAFPKLAPPGHLSGHVWAEVYVPAVGWVPVEPQEPGGFGHMPTGYVRMLHNPPAALAWPPAVSAAWSAMYHMGAYTPAYEEK